MKTIIFLAIIPFFPFMLLELIIRILVIVFVGLPVMGYSEFWGIKYHTFIKTPNTRSARIMEKIMTDKFITWSLLLKLKKKYNG